MLWGIGPVQQQAAYGLTVDRLRRQIHSGLLLPAEKLPPERQLSDDFGISRATLREALRVLETSDYITVRRGAQGGAFVKTDHGLREIAELDGLGQHWDESDLRAVQGSIREPEEVATAALFLASGEASFINGTALYVDNGWYAKG